MCATAISTTVLFCFFNYDNNLSACFIKFSLWIYLKPHCATTSGKVNRNQKGQKQFNCEFYSQNMMLVTVSRHKLC